MKHILELILNRFSRSTSRVAIAKVDANAEIVRIYNDLKYHNLIPADEPNVELARKVFLDFNEFHMKNLAIHHMYLKFVPQSLLPYPKNYIKCAYYILLASLEKERDPEMFEATQRVGVSLFIDYPNYVTYQENLKHKAMLDDVVFGDLDPMGGRKPREEFKRVYGTYQISKDEYDRSPSSIDATRERLLYDFGIVPDIEGDVEWPS